jgi:hypothetical protein
MLQPAFTEDARNDPQRSYLTSYFDEPWHGLFEGRAHTESVRIDEAGILVMDDKASEVDAALARFLEREAP